LSHSSQAAGSPAARHRVALYALLVATCLLLLWIVAHRPMLGVRGQHAYGYRPVARWSAALLLVGLAAPWAAAVAFALRRGPGLSGRQQWAVVAALTGGSLVLHVGTACAPKLYPGAELAWSFLERHREGAYSRRAAAARPVKQFLSNYVHGLDVSPVADSPHWVHVHHAEVHPPGLTLGFVALERLYVAWPRLAAAADRCIDALFPSVAVMRQKQEAHRIRHPVAVAMTAAASTIVVASLLPLVCFVAVRDAWGGEQALVAAALCAVIPGTHLFNPSIDQAYPTVALAVCALGVRAVTQRAQGAAVAFGALLFAALFVHIGLALAVVVLAAAVAAAWCAGHGEHAARQAARAGARPLAAAAVGFFTPALVLHVWLGYPTLRVAMLCLRNNHLFNEAMKRTYWAWLAATPLEFGLSLGFGMLLVAGAGWLREAQAAVRARSLRGRSAPLLAVGGVMVALTLLGINRGETARLWLFLTPMVVAAAVAHVWRRSAQPRRLLAALAALQALQAIVLSVALDAGLTTSFFVGLLRQG